MVFNHIENYLNGFGFRKNEREGYFDIKSQAVRNPVGFELTSINWITHLSYIKRN